MSEHSDACAGGDEDRDGPYDKTLRWGRREIRYRGPLPSLQAIDGEMGVPPLVDGGNELQWLLAEPKSLHLHRGLRTLCETRTVEDRAFARARARELFHAGEDKRAKSVRI